MPIGANTSADGELKVGNKKMYDDERKQKVKREASNVVICLIIFAGGIILSAFIGSFIPALIAFILMAIIYQRDL